MNTDFSVKPYFGMGLLLTIAAILFSQLYPQFSDQIPWVLLVTGIAGTVLIFLSQLLLTTRLQRLMVRIIFSIILVTGVYVIFYLFIPNTAARFLPALIIGGVALVLALVWLFLRRPKLSASTDAVPTPGGNPIDNLIPINAERGLAEKIFGLFHAEKDLELATSHFSTASSIAGTLGVREQVNRMPSETQAAIAANQAAEKAGIPPLVYNDLSYQVKKLDAEVAQILKRADVELDLFKEQGVYKIRVGAVSNLATRDIDEMLRFNNEILELNKQIEAEQNADIKKIRTDTRAAMLRAFETRYGPKKDGDKQDSKAPFGPDVG